MSINKIQLERLTIPQSEKDGSSSLFVLNKSNPPGNINMTVNSNGRQIPVQIPITFIPFDLSMFADKNDILRDPAFRRPVSRGFIHIVSEESARQALEDPTVKAEYQRVYKVVSDDSTDLDMLKNNVEAHRSEIASVMEDNTDSSTLIYAETFVDRLEFENSDDLLVELRAKAQTLDQQSIEYIMNNSKESTIKKWCSEYLAG